VGGGGGGGGGGGLGEGRGGRRLPSPAPPLCSRQQPGSCARVDRLLPSACDCGDAGAAVGRAPRAAAAAVAARTSSATDCRVISSDSPPCPARVSTMSDASEARASRNAFSSLSAGAAGGHPVRWAWHPGVFAAPAVCAACCGGGAPHRCSSVRALPAPPPASSTSISARVAASTTAISASMGSTLCSGGGGRGAVWRPAISRGNWRPCGHRLNAGSPGRPLGMQSLHLCACRRACPNVHRRRPLRRPGRLRLANARLRPRPGAPATRRAGRDDSSAANPTGPVPLPCSPCCLLGAARCGRPAGWLRRRAPGAGHRPSAQQEPLHQQPTHDMPHRMAGHRPAPACCSSGGPTWRLMGISMPTTGQASAAHREETARRSRWGL
jgi:hypothetical protein